MFMKEFYKSIMEDVRAAMGKTKKILSIILSLSMMVQTSAMAGELLAEEESLFVDEIITLEDTGEAEIFLDDEEIPEEVTLVDNSSYSEDEMSEENLLEEEGGSRLFSEEVLVNEITEEPVGAVAEDIDVSPSWYYLESDEDDLSGEPSATGGKRLIWG